MSSVSSAYSVRSWGSSLYAKACSLANALEGRVKKLGVSDSAIQAVKTGLPMGIAVGAGAVASTALAAQVTGKVAAAILTGFLGAQLVKININNSLMIPGAFVILSECLGKGTFTPLIASSLAGKAWSYLNEKIGAVGKAQIAYFVSGTVVGAGIHLSAENPFFTLLGPLGGAALGKIFSVATQCDVAFLKAGYLGFTVNHAISFSGSPGMLLIPAAAAVISEYGLAVALEQEE